MTRILQGNQTILNAKASTGAGVALDVSNYKAVVLQIATAGNANLTVKFAASISKTKPDFSIPASVANPYDFVELNWLNNNSTVPGATGFVVAGTDQIRLYEINTNYIKWLCPIVTARVAGNVTVIMDAANDYTR